MNRKREELLTRGMGELFIKQALPGMIGTLIIGLYNLVDAIYIGQFIGKDGVGAVSLVYSVVLFNQAILILIGLGSMSLLSRSIGERNERTIRKLLGNLTLTVSILSLVFSVLIFSFTRPIVGFLGGRESILDLGESYLRIVSVGFVPAALGPALNMLLRGEGRMKEAMIIASAGAILNIILDPIFIHVLGLGISGAAMATVISQTVYLILNIIYFTSGKSVIRFNLRDFRFAFDLMPKILGVGASAMFMLVTASVQQVILFKSLAVYGGNDHVALMGAAFRVFLFAFIPLAGIGQGLQPILGMNYGAKRFGRVKQAYIFFTTIAAGLAGLSWLCFMLLPKAILRWFITDPGLVSWGQGYFRILFAVFFLSSINLTALTLFQALGKGGKAAVLSLSRQIVFFIPIALVLPLFTGVIGLWWAVPASEVLTLFMTLIFLVVEYRRLTSQTQTDDGNEQGEPLALNELVSNHIRRVLEMTRGKVHGPGGAAELLGVNPSTLRNRMNKLGITYGRKM